jgi:hypothetical protein
MAGGPHPSRRMDESDQGPKRAVAIAIDLPLGVLPGICTQAVDFSSKQAALDGCQAETCTVST